MKGPFIRVWQELDFKEVKEHLLIAGSISGDCGNCKEVGISFEAKNCPKCQAHFKYMCTRISGSPKEAKRLRAKRPDLVIIDFQDFKEAQARKKVHGLLNDTD